MGKSKSGSSVSGFWVFIFIIGIIVSLTGVGAIIGVPMLGSALRHLAIPRLSKD